jgi:hypothetical protein
MMKEFEEESCNIDSYQLDEYKATKTDQNPIEPQASTSYKRLSSKMESLFQRSTQKLLIADLENKFTLRPKTFCDQMKEASQKKRAVTEDDNLKLSKQEFQNLELRVIDDGEDSDEEEECNLDEEFLDDRTTIAKFIEQIYQQKKESQALKACATKNLDFTIVPRSSLTDRSLRSDGDGKFGGFVPKFAAN